MRVGVNPDSPKRLPLCFFAMPRRTTTPAIEAIVRDNVRRLLQKHYEGKPGQLKRKNKTVNLRGLQDFLKGGTCYLTSLQPWADALHVRTYHLFVKDLDIDDLPELVPGRRVRTLEKLREELLEDQGSETNRQREDGHRTAARARYPTKE